MFKLNAKELIDGEEQLEKQKRHEKTLRGSEEEEKIFKEMQNSMKSLGIKNTVVINGWKDNGINNTVKREYDFLIICEPLRAIFHIESKTAFNSNNFRNAAKQLKSGLDFFQDKLPFPESEKWSYVRVASFANMKELISKPTEEKANTKEEISNTKKEKKITKKEMTNTKEEMTHRKEEMANSTDEKANTKKEKKITKKESTNTIEEMTNTKEEMTNTKEEKANTKEELANTKEEISNKKKEKADMMKNIPSICTMCQQFVAGPNWNFSIWWKDIEALLAPQNSLESTETYTDIVKFLLHQMLMQKDCLTDSDITNYSQEKIERISTLENIFFWNNIQFSLLTNITKKRVVFASTFGTGKTSCIKAKAEQLLKENQKVVIVVFQDGDTSKDSLLKKAYEIHFQGIAGQHKEGITIESIRGTGVIIFSTNTNQKSNKIC